MFMSDRVQAWYEIAFGAGPMIGELSEQTYDNIGLDLEADKAGVCQVTVSTSAVASRANTSVIISING
jgi:hypothetical protein